MTRKQPTQIAADLATRIRGDVFADIIHRVAYSTDASSYRIVPQCVVAPADVRDVIAVVRYAADRGLPIVARGAGSGLAGESLCSGIVLDMTRYMKGIRRIDDETVTCGPGVVLDDLNKALLELGRKIGPDPSSANRATVGASPPTTRPAHIRCNMATRRPMWRASRRYCRMAASLNSRTM